MMCPKRKIVLICLYLFCHATYAQNWCDDPTYYEGAVILEDRSTLRGAFSYKQSTESLSFKNGQQVSATEALYFQFYSPKEKNNRYFLSHIDRAKNHKFYEILCKGKIPLYRKTVIVKKDMIDRKNSLTTLHISKDIVEDRLYMLVADTMTLIDNFEDQVFPLLKDQINAVSNYIVTNQLDITLRSHQVLIINHYNDLFEGH